MVLLVLEHKRFEVPLKVAGTISEILGNFFIKWIIIMQLEIISNQTQFQNY